MLQYQSTQQLLGCDNETCLAEIGGALGADYLVTGSITATGSKLVLQLQLMSIRDSRVESRESREHEGEISGLFEEVRGATKVLVRELLGKKSGSLKVAVSEEGATIKVDGVTVATSPSPPLVVAGGTHAVTVEKDQFVQFKQDVEILENRETALDVRLRPSIDFLRRERASAGTWRTVSWVSIGVGVAGLAGGGGLYYVAMDKTKKLNRDVTSYNAAPERATIDYKALGKREREIAQLDLYTLVSGGVGVAALLTGVIIRLAGSDPDRYGAKSYVDSPGDSEPAMPGLKFLPIWVPGGAGLSVIF